MSDMVMRVACLQCGRRYEYGVDHRCPEDDIARLQRERDAADWRAFAATWAACWIGVGLVAALNDANQARRQHEAAQHVLWRIAEYGPNMLGHRPEWPIERAREYLGEEKP